MHMSTHIHVCIHIRWTCTYIFKCPFKYIIYKHIYIYNTHINPVCEETLGPLVLEYIYMLRKTHQMSALSFYSSLLEPKQYPQTRSSHYIYIYVHMYMYIYMYVYNIVYIYIYIFMYVCMCIYVCMCT